MNLHFRLHQIRKKIKERKYLEVLSNPVELFYLIILFFRSVFLRLIPRFKKMYFISSKLIEIEKTLSVKELEYSYQVFDLVTNEIREFVQNRCNESNKMIASQYSSEVEKRFNNRVKAHALLINGWIVSVFFVSERPVIIDQVDYRYIPNNKEIVITDIYTLKSHRKKGLYLFLLKNTISKLKDDGFDSITMWLMKHNRATIKAQIKAGFNEIFKTVSMFSWFGLKMISVNSSVISLKDL